MAPPSDLNNSRGALSPAENSSRALQPRAMPLAPVVVSHTPPALSAAPSAFSLLKALRHRLGIALTVGVIVAVAVAAGVWFFLPPSKTTARMQLNVAPETQHILFRDDNDRVSSNVFLKNQAVSIRDRFSLLAVLRKQEIAKLSIIREQTDPVQWLEEKIAVEFPSSGFIYISLSGDRPQELLKIVAEVTQTYLDNYVNKEHNEREAHRAKLKALNDKWQQKWEKAKKDLDAQQKLSGGINEESIILLQQLQLEEIEHVKRRIAEVREKLIVLSVEMGLNPDWESKVWPAYVAALNCQPGPGLPIHQAVTAILHDEYLIASAAPNSGVLNEAEVDALIERDGEIIKLKADLPALQAYIARARQQYQPRQFEKYTKPYLDKVKALEKGITARRKTLRPLIVDAMRRHILSTERGKRNTTDANYRSCKLMESKLIDKLNELSREHKRKLNDAGAFLQTLEDIEQAKKLVQKTTEYMLKMEVEQEAPPRITPSSKEAFIVNVDETKRKMTITAGSAVGALFVILLAFSWFEFQTRKVYTPDEVVQDLGLQLVGTVPDHSPRGWLPWSRGNDNSSAYTQSMLTESVDSARTMLLHVASREQLQIVMITSALSGEGKTSLASHLAASLARAGRRTILVDSDLRNPTLHRLFERDRSPGLSELLRGEADLANVIGETSVPNLWLIPAGKADSVALQALALDPVAKLFERLRLHYDFVLVDSCPVLPVADAMLVGQHVDAVIFSLLREVSRMPRVYAAYQRLAVLGIRMLGAVVNGTQPNQYPSDYHYLTQDQE